MGKKKAAERTKDQTRKNTVSLSVSKRDRSHIKRDTYKSQLSEFSNQLRSFGLWIKDVTGDGNCLFRAFSDQLHGHDRNHKDYRQQTIQLMVQNRDDFAPFVEDDETFESYTARLMKDGIWAGNMELQALSLAFGVNIVIHQLSAPRWEIVNHQGSSVRFVHLSYHSQEHYASVRSLLDKGNGPALPIPRTLQALTDIQIEEQFHIKPNAPLSEEEKLVMRSTGCQDIGYVRRVMADLNNDAELAIESIIETLCSTNNEDTIPEPASDLVSRQQQDAHIAAPATPSAAEKDTQEAVAKVARNGDCPCGSGKKYRKCCSVKESSMKVAPKSSRIVIVEDLDNATRKRKDKKREKEEKRRAQRIQEAQKDGSLIDSNLLSSEQLAQLLAQSSLSI